MNVTRPGIDTFDQEQAITTSVSLHYHEHKWI